MQERISYSEFIDWMAYAQIEPLPEARADLRNALLLLLLAHINKGKRGKKLKLETFLPDWWRDRKDPRRLAAKFRALTSQLDTEEAEVEEIAQGANVRRA